MAHDRTRQPETPHPGTSGEAKKHPNEHESAREWERKQAPAPADEQQGTVEQKPTAATRVRR
jgi:hypothetical protein